MTSSNIAIRSSIEQNYLSLKSGKSSIYSSRTSSPSLPKEVRRGYTNILQKQVISLSQSWKIHLIPAHRIGETRIQSAQSNRWCTVRDHNDLVQLGLIRDHRYRLLSGYVFVILPFDRISESSPIRVGIRQIEFSSTMTWRTGNEHQRLVKVLGALDGTKLDLKSDPFPLLMFSLSRRMLSMNGIIQSVHKEKP